MEYTVSETHFPLSWNDTIIMVPADDATSFAHAKKLAEEYDYPLKGACFLITIRGTGEWD